MMPSGFAFSVKGWPLMTNNLTLSATLQEAYFDRAAVIAHLGKANARRMMRAGAFLRRRIRTDILRRRSGPSAPGSPPHVHSQSDFATLRNIQYALNSADESMIVGPVRTNVSQKAWSRGKKTIPEMVEFGGTVSVVDWKPDAETPWIPVYMNPPWKPPFQMRTRQATYAARPFMGPGLEKEIAAGTIGKLFAALE